MAPPRKEKGKAGIKEESEVEVEQDESQKPKETLQLKTRSGRQVQKPDHLCISWASSKGTRSRSCTAKEQPETSGKEKMDAMQCNVNKNEGPTMRLLVATGAGDMDTTKAVELQAPVTEFSMNKAPADGTGQMEITQDDMDKNDGVTAPASGTEQMSMDKNEGAPAPVADELVVPVKCPRKKPAAPCRPRRYASKPRRRNKQSATTRRARSPSEVMEPIVIVDLEASPQPGPGADEFVDSVRITDTELHSLMRPSHVRLVKMTDDEVEKYIRANNKDVLLEEETSDSGTPIPTSGDEEDAPEAVEPEPVDATSEPHSMDEEDASKAVEPVDSTSEPHLMDEVEAPKAVEPVVATLEPDEGDGSKPADSTEENNIEEEVKNGSGFGLEAAASLEPKVSNCVSVLKPNPQFVINSGSIDIGPSTSIAIIPSSTSIAALSAALVDQNWGEEVGELRRDEFELNYDENYGAESSNQAGEESRRRALHFRSYLPDMTVSWLPSCDCSGLRYSESASAHLSIGGVPALTVGTEASSTEENDVENPNEGAVAIEGFTSNVYDDLDIVFVGQKNDK